MPIPQTYRVDPRDLQKNIAIGVCLPFNTPSAFRSSYSTKEQIKYNLINLLLTNKGERIENPEFGADLKRELFEQIDENTFESIKNKIIDNVNVFIPEVTLTNVTIIPQTDNSKINVNIEYYVNISGESENLNINFE
jgi:phage baseplate assembly protein W